MKKIIVLIATLAIYHYSSAQLLSFGLRAGVSSSGLQVKNSFDASASSNPVTYKGGDKVLGWHIGFYARANISKLFVQPEVLFANSGGNIVVSDSGYSATGKITFSNLSIPVMLGLKLGKVIHIDAGPAFNIVLNKKVTDNIKDIDQKYKGATVGYQAGIGADLLSLVSIDLKYEGNLSKLGDAVTIPGAGTFNTDMRCNQVILSVGIKL